jgi:hypothetical protein
MSIFDRKEWENWDNTLNQVRDALGGEANKSEPGKADAQPAQDQSWQAPAAKSSSGGTTMQEQSGKAHAEKPSDVGPAPNDDLQRVVLYTNVLMDLLKSVQQIAADIGTLTSKHAKEKR